MIMAAFFGNSKAHGNAKIYGNGEVYGFAEVYGDAQIYGNADVYGNAKVFGGAWVYGNVYVYGNALVHGKARVNGNASIGSFGDIEQQSDVFLVTNVGDEVETLTVYKGKEGLLFASIVNFDGPTEEFLAQAKDFYNEKVYNEFKLLVQLAKGRILG